MAAVDRLRLTCAALAAQRRPFALVGALAVGARARPRTTADLDFCVDVPSDAEAERTVLEMQGRGFVLLSVLEHEDSGRLATARFVAPGSPATEPDVDLLFATCGVEPEVVRGAEVITVLDVRVPVACLGHLIAMKVLSHDDEKRPQDRLDLAALLERANQEDVAVARQTLALITERGFHRGKVLADEFDAWLRSLRPH